jgi:hypothetical protein
MAITKYCFSDRRKSAWQWQYLEHALCRRQNYVFTFSDAVEMLFAMNMPQQTHGIFWMILSEHRRTRVIVSIAKFKKLKYRTLYVTGSTWSSWFSKGHILCSPVSRQNSDRTCCVMREWHSLCWNILKCRI